MPAIPAGPGWYEFFIHLADDEWGSELMGRVAAEALADPAYAAYQPLVVSVFEHAGWWLKYALLEGGPTVVSSANDLAVFHGAARRFREQYANRTTHYVGTIRRQNKSATHGQP